jgi:hypothetical protein
VRAGLLLHAVPEQPSAAASPWPYQAPADGVDPDAAGCSADAITVHARRVAATAGRTVLGQVQLRYSPSVGAAWSRFEGFGSLDHLASRQAVDIEVQACREQDGTLLSFRSAYLFDYHWSDLLRTATGPVYARVSIFVDGALAASGESDRLPLP